MTPSTRSSPTPAPPSSLLHTFALVHDDVMDDSDRRHGHRHRPRRARPAPRRRRLARPPRALRHRCRHPRRRSGLRLQRPPPDRGAARRQGGLRRAPPRGQRRPVPRPARHGPAQRQPRAGPAHLPVQVGEVHDRAAAPPGRSAGRAQPPRRRDRPAVGLRPAARGGVPAEGRPARGVSAIRRSPGSRWADDLREGKPTLLHALARAAALRGGPSPPRRARRGTGPLRSGGRRHPGRLRGNRCPPAGDRHHRRPRRPGPRGRGPAAAHRSGPATP